MSEKLSEKLSGVVLKVMLTLFWALFMKGPKVHVHAYDATNAKCTAWMGEGALESEGAGALDLSFQSFLLRTALG
jgi:hypothetical protein